jgi:hypothetical protein
MHRITATLLALVLASPAMAGDLSYNFLEGGYLRVEFDNSGFDLDGDGFGIGGSFELNENLFAFASYSTADFDFGIDLNQLSAGVGYHVDISQNSDFFAALSFVRAEAEAAGLGSADEDGIGVTIGVRSMVSDQVELFGTLSYVDLGGDADGTSVGGGALYSFTDTFAVGANVEFDEDVTSYGLTARLYFGQ